MDLHLFDDIETIDHLDNMTFDQVLSRAVKAWAETEKTKNEAIGEARAQQAAAYIDAITSGKSKKLGKKEKFYWITVNPKDGVDLPQLIQKVQKMVKKVWIKGYSYIFELGTTGRHHSHILLYSNYDYSHTFKECASTVKTITDTTKSACFNVVALPDMEAVKTKMRYLKGDKSKEKMAAVQASRIWRKENGLQEIYHSEVPLSCWDLGKVSVDEVGTQAEVQEEELQDNVQLSPLPPI